MIYLLRHGLDDEDYIGGFSNGSLTEEGRRQVINVALWMKNNLKIKKIISSDIKRAVETSEIVKEILDISFTLDSNLREQNKGLLNGMLKVEALKKYPEFMIGVDKDTVYPQGESLKDLYLRIKEYLNCLKNMEDDTLLITHRGVINMIYYLLNDIELDMNKERFSVVHASVHELDLSLKKIRRIK